jgi:hypothetical protein
MKEIIVTRAFNNQDIIGRLVLQDGVEVPFDTVFAIGGVVKKKHTDQQGVEVIDKFDVLEVSRIKDRDYRPAA